MSVLDFTKEKVTQLKPVSEEMTSIHNNIQKGDRK